MNLPGFATRNIRLKGLAAVLATVMWASVAYASNPPDTRSVTVKVPQSSGAVDPYVLVHAIPDLVVRVSGTRDHLQAFDPADLVVHADYKAITQVGIQTLPLSVINNDRDVVLDNPPTSVTAEVDRLDSRTVPVVVDYSQQPPPQGYVVVAKSATPSSVTIIGPQHELAGVVAKVTVDLANQKTNFQADEKLALVDSATGQPVTNIGLTVAGHPQDESVLVTIEVAAVLTSRASAVVPKVSGTVAAGHFLASETVTPATVVLNGPQDLLNTLNSVGTEAISLNGVTGTLSFTVEVLPPAGVTAFPATVTVTVTVGAYPAPPTASPSPSPTVSPSTSPG